jgi:hypothetical protein
MIIVGIDNGLTGGIVALSDHPGAPVAMCVMPTQPKKTGREVSAVAVWDFLRMLGPVEKLIVMLETPGKHSPGVHALCSMWDSYGVIRGVLESRQIAHHRVAPQTWQSAILGKLAKGETKPAALAKAREIWPDETWLATPRSTVPHDGLVDAALIGEHLRRIVTG